jgi:hypothetical protein
MNIGDHLGDLSIDGKIILRELLRKYIVYEGVD